MRTPHTAHQVARLGQFAVLEAEVTDDEVVIETNGLPDTAYWTGVIGVEGMLTGDGRIVEKESLRWDVPIPIRMVISDMGAHDGAEVVGKITDIWRGEGGLIHGSGPFDMGGESGREAFRQVRDELTTGVSMDLDDMSFEIRIARELIEADSDLLAEGEDSEEAEEPEMDEEGRVTVVKMDGDDEVMVTTDARIRAATIVAIPAFIEAHIGIDSSNAKSDDTEPVDKPVDEEDEADVVRASAAPAAPPKAWFANPTLHEPTPLTVTKDGQVYGHLAIWGTCHTSHTNNGQCLEPPASNASYAYFRTGAVMTDADEEVAVGRITLGTTHAGYKLSAAATDEHYDNTGSVAAYVSAGEDAHGIWLAGALKPEVTPDQVRTLRGSPLSGDWRRVGANLELLAVLAVNGPGFPIPRPAGLVASGQMQALVASSGMIAPKRVPKPGSDNALAVEDLRWLKRLADRERETHASAMANRVKAAKMAAARRRVDKFATKRHKNKGN